ncbi:MAG: DUF1573 domain-containing protein [Candidatus Yanofskybacteria bacterium]|nr:DUF1573 domain-containing protein [Candidatus Yanofskybacteria bacterium]
MNKLKSIFYFVIIFGAAIGILVWIAGPDDISGGADNVVSAGNLILDEAFFDFGNISMAAGVVSHEFKVINAGDGEEVINQIYTSCMCTEASFVTEDTKFGPFGMAGHGFIPKFNGKMGAGEEAIIKVDFDPAAHGPAGVGPVDRVVYVFRKGSDKPLELMFKAVVTP